MHREYTYDAQGNMLSDGNKQYLYDAMNRLKEVRSKDGSWQKNRYDGEGLRAELEENGRLVSFIFDKDKVVQEADADRNTIRYIRGYELISSDSEKARTYYHYACDELGSITHIADEDGQLLNRYEYDALGNFITKEEAIENRFGYTGEQYDPIAGMYYLRARFYSPAIGRFIQEDTYYGDGLNLYAYCHNNPVVYVDPSGNYSVCHKKYKKYREQGMTAAEAYYMVTGKNPLNQAGSDYMVQHEQNIIMNYYQQSVNRNYNKYKGTGTAQQVGSWTHKAVADDMNNNFIPQQLGNLPYIDTILIESNFHNGNLISNNMKGSSRIDIAITNNVNNNIHVGDIKTGKAHYGSKQKNKNENNINGYNNQRGYSFTHQEIKPQ